MAAVVTALVSSDVLDSSDVVETVVAADARSHRRKHRFHRVMRRRDRDRVAQGVTEVYLDAGAAGIAQAELCIYRHGEIHLVRTARPRCEIDVERRRRSELAPSAPAVVAART